ncbi:MAG: MarR family winged helix-turn-helix transcriptional regulator [Candidatus Avispirillum sp.]
MANKQDKIFSVGKEVHSLDNLIGRYIDLTAGKSESQYEGITGNNGRILCYIARNEGRDIYQRDVEKEFCITRSTASKVVTLMEEKGLVKRQRVPHDARLKKLVLTDASRAFADMMKENMYRVESALTEGLSEEEIRIFIAIAEKMKNNIRDKVL